ncbi:cobalt-precorrin 5A hydrolase [Clostridium sp.]|uniref:cobalt-precorrin 5A hydrolase n=1 Tax=Clostridium sp. TaxID=1506 RepID=UPI002FCC46C7
MKSAIISYSNQGLILSKVVAKVLSDIGHSVDVYSTRDNTEFDRLTLSEFSKKVFEEYKFGIYIGSCGIAVRGIAPYIKDKESDPGIVVIDDIGESVIPILSGHIGGANRLSRDIANGISSRAILTTGSDIRGIIPVDEFSVNNDLYIENIAMAKVIASRIIDGHCVTLISDERILSDIPHHYRGDSFEFGVYIGSRAITPFKNTLRLIPKNLVVGIGCRKGTSPEMLEQFIISTLRDNNLLLSGVRSINSINLKSSEEGIVKFCAKYKIPFNTYGQDRLSKVQGEFTSSSFVKSITGVDNVCERSALVNGGKLILRKTVYKGMTISIAKVEGGVNFEY